MALVKDNDTAAVEFTSFEYPVKASAVIYAGALVVCSTADGFAKPGLTATGLKVLGVAKKAVTGGASDGDTKVVCEGPIGKSGKRRLFKFKNDSGTPLVQAGVGSSAYIKDDNTFTGEATGRSVGGILRRVDSDGVWIELSL